MSKVREKARAAGARTPALLLDHGQAKRDLARRLVTPGYAVRGGPAHGGVSAFYKALVYFPASKRHPGRPRKKRTPLRGRL
jgi:hypothetical protein